VSKNKINVIIFVINPSSGTGEVVGYEPIIKRHSDLHAFKYMIYYTSGTGDSEKLKNHIDEFKPEMLIAVGGDGTINLVASLITGTQMILGIIPSGSANGLAFNLKIPTNFEYALKINLEAQIKSIDAIKINNEHYCFHLSDLGLNARVVKRFEKEGSKGLLGYGKQLFKELLTKKTYFSYSLKTDNETKKSKAEMLVITNAHSFGTGVRINPAGELSDGLFEIVVIKPYPWWFVFTFIIAGFSGHLDKMQSVNIFKTRIAEIKLEESQEFQIDGEIKGKTDSVKVELLRNSLNVVYNV